MSKSPPPSPPPPFALADLDYIQKIGTSQFGEVWKVKSATQSQIFTLKKITKSRIQKIQSQFTREINKWYKISHKNLVRIISHYEDNDFFYLLMEQTEGIPLSKKLLIEKKLEKSTAIEIITQIIDAIEYLHGLHPPVMYKHIKPDNILVDLDGQVKMTDFCWANVAGEEDSNVIGSSTLEYLAPEMFNKPDFGISIDVWCIGILLYEVNLGKSPFKKNFSVGILSDIQKCNVYYPEDMDPVLKDLVSKILVKEPGKRISLADIKKHKWFVKVKKIDDGCKGITAEYLKKQIEQKIEENEKLSTKIRAANTEVEVFNENCSKLEEKIAAVREISRILTDENEKTLKNLNDLDVSEADNNDNSEDDVETLKVKIGCLSRKFEILNTKYKNLNEIKELKRKSFEFIAEQFEGFSKLLIMMNERLRSLASQSLMMARVLVYSLPLDEVEMFNLLCGSAGAQFVSSCESLLVKVQENSDLMFLKERYNCELSILYQEKQAELLKEYEDKKSHIIQKSKKFQQENYKILKSFAETLVNKKLQELDLGSQLLDNTQLKEKQEKFKSLLKLYKDTHQSIQSRKREILKAKIVKYNKNKDLESKVSTLSNLTEAILQEKLDLDLFRIRRLC